MHHGSVRVPSAVTMSSGHRVLKVTEFSFLKYSLASGGESCLGPHVLRCPAVLSKLTADCVCPSSAPVQVCPRPQSLCLDVIGKL